MHGCKTNDKQVPGTVFESSQLLLTRSFYIPYQQYHHNVTVPCFDRTITIYIYIYVSILCSHTRWAPSTYLTNGVITVITYNPFKWPFTWVTGTKTSVNGHIPVFIQVFHLTSESPHVFKTVVLFRVTSPVLPSLFPAVLLLG